MPLKPGKSQETISQNVATEVRSGRDPKQAAAIAYAEARRSRDRSGSLMGAPRDPKNGQAHNQPGSQGDPRRVPGDASFEQVPGESAKRAPRQMGSPFDPKDSFVPGYTGHGPGRSPSVMGDPKDPDDRTSSLPDRQGLPRDATIPTSRARSLSEPVPHSPMGLGHSLDAEGTMEHFAKGMERYASKDARGLNAPMGASARQRPGGQGGNGNAQ